MSKDKLTDYDATASNNTDVGGISVAEGMLPSGVNNAIREQMSHLKDFASGTTGIDVLSLADDDASHAIKLQAPSAVTADTTFTLPDGDGTADQVLKTDGSGQLGWADRHANPSLIVNGAMQVAQRAASVAGITAGGYKALDRFDIDLSSAGTWTISQDTDVPAGFGSSMKFLCTAADASLGSTDRIAFRQKFEGQDLQQLKKGTTAAKTFTVSFYVKSNKTGTYILEFYDLNNSRHINKSYTIISAATWEYKTITFDADTNGAFDNDPNASAQLQFWLGAGSAYTSGSLQTSWGANVTANRAVGNVNLADSTSNEWQITGVKLELGSTATDFEHRSFSDELQRCMRFYEKSYAYSVAPGTAVSYPSNIGITVRGMDEETSGQRYITNTMRVEKRADPTNTFYDDAGNAGKVTTFNNAGTGTNNVGIALVVTQPSMIGCGPSNSAIWGFGFFYESDAEL